MTEAAAESLVLQAALVVKGTQLPRWLLEWTGHALPEICS